MHMMRDRPDHSVPDNAGRMAMVGLMFAWNSADVAYRVPNAVKTSLGVEKRVNHRYATNGAGNPVLLATA